MKKIIPYLSLACCLLYSCNSPAPQEYFGKAVLNSNLLYGFAGNGMQRELESPSVKLVNENTGATAPMTRAELINSKLQAVESNYEKVKSLLPTDETKAMLNASIALYEYVIPVYKNEYSQLAKLYDDGAAASMIAAAENNITVKYQSKFAELYETLGMTGKAYAKKNGIKVREVNPSPQ